MLKVLTNFESMEVKEVPSLIQAFDPRINRCWLDDNRLAAHVWTFAELMKFCTVFYCPENFEHDPDMFVSFPSVAAHEKTVWKELFTQTPEDLRGYLCFVSALGASDGNSSWGVSIPERFENWRMQQYIDDNIVPSVPSQTSYDYSNNFWVWRRQTNMDPAQIAAALIPYLKIIKKYYEQAPTRSVAYLGIGEYTFPIFYLIRGMATGARLYYSVDGTNALTARQFVESFEEISNNSQIELCEVSFRDNVWLRYRVPVDRKNRDRFAKVYGYGQDVVSLLGDGTDSFATKTNKKTGKEYTREAKPIRYGVELELATNKTIKEIIDAQDDEVRIVAKQDGSISGRGRNLMELVSMPLDLRTHRKAWLWLRKFYANGTYPDFDTSNNTNNGMHIHVSKDAFGTEKHLQHFCWFFCKPSHFDFIFTMSQRPTRSNLVDWAAPPTSTKKNKAFFDEIVRRCSSGGHRGAVELSNRTKGKTVEVRIFKGLVSYATIIQNLEFVDALVAFTRDVSYARNTVAAFLEFVNNTPKNKYKLLKAFLKTCDIEDILAQEQLIAMCGGFSNPEGVYHHIVTKGMEVTPKLLGYLNKKFGKGTFSVLDDGRLWLSQQDKAKLAAMDLDLFSTFNNRVAACV